MSREKYELEFFKKRNFFNKRADEDESNEVINGMGRKQGNTTNTLQWDITPQSQTGGTKRKGKKKRNSPSSEI